jgi:hypothetical protein
LEQHRLFRFAEVAEVGISDGLTDAEELAAEMLATTLGLDFDPDKSWDEKKEVYRELIPVTKENVDEYLNK